MTLKLEDLRVVTPLSSDFRMSPGREATLTDLIEVLKTQGAVLHYTEDIARYIRRTGPARYLILRWDDDA